MKSAVTGTVRDDCMEAASRKYPNKMTLSAMAVVAVGRTVVLIDGLTVGPAVGARVDLVGLGTIVGPVDGVFVAALGDPVNAADCVDANSE
jgi:hypothetical protein